MKLVVAVALLSLLAFPAISVAQIVPALVLIEEIEVQPAAFEQADKGKPLEIKSKEDAAKYFDKDALGKLAEEVDFENQLLLVFAWKGSGRDRLNVRTTATSAERFIFEIFPGKTKDLKPHVRVFALRFDAKWEVK